MVLDRDKLKKLLKEKGVKSLDDFNALFPNEQALFKLVYLAVEEAAKKWTMRHRDWAMIYSRLMIFFEDRMERNA